MSGQRSLLKSFVGKTEKFEDDKATACRPGEREREGRGGRKHRIQLHLSKDIWTPK